MSKIGRYQTRRFFRIIVHFVQKNLFLPACAYCVFTKMFHLFDARDGRHLNIGLRADYKHCCRMILYANVRIVVWRAH